MNYQDLWTEKYRPKSLDDLILDDSTREYVEEIKDSIPHLIMVGGSGIGKTTLARIIVEDILECDYLYINASDENGIDTIRDKVVNFSKTKSFGGGLKVIILDEFDGSTDQGQRCLRGIMEKENLVKNVRFIITGNFKSNIIEAIDSRCTAINIKPSISQQALRCLKILKAENIEYEKTDMTKIAHLVKRYSPDFRKTINELQKCSVTGKLEIDTDTLSDKALANEVVKAVSYGKTLEIRKKIIESIDEMGGDYLKLLNDMFEVVYDDTVLSEDLKKVFMMCIAKHMDSHENVANKEINCYSCILNMERSISE